VKQLAAIVMAVFGLGCIGLHEWNSALAQAPAAPVGKAPAYASPAWTNIPLTPNQPENFTLWTVEALTKVHQELTARAAKGQPLNARDLLPLPMARTHGYTAGYRTGKEPPSADLHEGVTDVYFIIGGSATMVAGGELVGKQKLTEGEYHGTSVKGGETFTVKAGDVLQIPPGMPHAAQANPGGFSYLLMKINIAQYPWPIVAGGFGVGNVGVPLAPNQPEKAVYWSVDDFRKQHQASAARAASRQTGPGGANLFPRMTYRTHGWVSVYRPTSIMTRPLPAELHMGVTDVYIVMGGSATIILDGNLDNKHVFCEPRAGLPNGESCLNLPLEYQGDCSAGCKGGQTIHLKAGDVFNLPPNSEHWVKDVEPTGPDAGFTYMLFKIQAGLYPWELTNWEF
jgi:quercetin dioxygenase-like cupin family protein